MVTPDFTAGFELEPAVLAGFRRRRPKSEAQPPVRLSMTGTAKRHQTLEIENPIAACGHCRFTVPLRGEWSVEGGSLVFRADPDPQPGRGPDLESCCENDPVIEFKHITAGGEELSAEHVAELQQTAGQAARPGTMT